MHRSPGSPRWRSRAALFAAASFSVGCTLITALDDSAYEANGNGDAAVGADGATLTDSSAIDAPGADADSNQPTFCTNSTSMFCDDFERTTILGQWTSVSQTGGGAVRLAHGSGVHSSVLRLDGCTGGQCTAALFKHIPANVAHATYAFDVQMVVPLQGNMNFSGLGLTLSDGRRPQAFLLLAGAAEVDLGHQTNLPDGGDALYTGTPLSIAFPIATWVRVQMDMVFGLFSTATVSVNGSIAATTSLSPSFVPGPLDIIAGNFFSSGASDMTILIDNVTFDYSL